MFAAHVWMWNDTFCLRRINRLIRNISFEWCEWELRRKLDGITNRRTPWFMKNAQFGMGWEDGLGGWRMLAKLQPKKKCETLQAIKQMSASNAERSLSTQHTAHTGKVFQTQFINSKNYRFWTEMKCSDLSPTNKFVWKMTCTLHTLRYGDTQNVIAWLNFSSRNFWFCLCVCLRFARDIQPDGSALQSKVCAI